MSGFEYGNTRLRARKSQLFTREEIRALAELKGMEALINALLKTRYQQRLEVELARLQGLRAVIQALKRDLVEEADALKRFYKGNAVEMLEIVLKSYDVDNIISILRGHSSSLNADEIEAGLLPLGFIEPALLDALARAGDVRIAIDMMATMQLPGAKSLVKLRVEKPGVGLTEMELALKRWYHQRARTFLENGSRSPSLRKMIDLDADLANLLTVLRFAHASVGRREPSEGFGKDELRAMFLEGGRLTEDVLMAAGEKESVEEAVRELSGTTYGEALTSGLDLYHQSRRLSVLERVLAYLRLNEMKKLILNDPLGIGVVLGYLALKINEVSNLRWIAWGNHLDLGAEKVVSELVFPL